MAKTDAQQNVLEWQLDPLVGSQPFVWHEPYWQQLQQRCKQGTLPHALLFSGDTGLGKNHLAHALALSLFCQLPQENGNACGKCKSCQLFFAKSHPDFMFISPEEGSQIIKIDQIRCLVELVNATPMLGGYRVIIINPANAMHIAAANALLKTLEEPTPNTLIILVNQQGLRLPATITSRCQKFLFSKPTDEEAMVWLRERLSAQPLATEQLCLLLKLANGSPLKAYKYAGNHYLSLRNSLYQGLIQLANATLDPVTFAAQHTDAAVDELSQLVLNWLIDLLRIKTAENVDLVNNDFQKDLMLIASKIVTNNLLEYLEHVQQIYSRMVSSGNLNKVLVLEELFIKWVRICS